MLLMESCLYLNHQCSAVVVLEKAWSTEQYNAKIQCFKHKTLRLAFALSTRQEQFLLIFNRKS